MKIVKKQKIQGNYSLDKLSILELMELNFKTNFKNKEIQKNIDMKYDLLKRYVKN